MRSNSHSPLFHHQIQERCSAMILYRDGESETCFPPSLIMLSVQQSASALRTILSILSNWEVAEMKVGSRISWVCSSLLEFTIVQVYPRDIFSFCFATLADKLEKQVYRTWRENCKVFCFFPEENTFSRRKSVLELIWLKARRNWKKETCCGRRRKWMMTKGNGKESRKTWGNESEKRKPI